MAKIDYYNTLGLSNSASADEIKKAYRKLAMQYHPDRNNGKEEWATDKFKDINEAFSVLGDPKKRRQYDHFGVTGNIGDIFDSQTTRATFEDLMDDFGGDDLSCDFLDDIFAGDFRGRSFAFHRFRRGFGGSGRSRYETQRGIDFEDLFEQIINPRVSGVNYEIALSKEQALKGIERELVRNGKRLKIKIPPGVKTGSKIRLRNALKTTDRQLGDITIIIKIISSQ
ncbi:MAG: DnaJ domain-containing protein [Dehalococcoidia bacterium]|jgi:curved DNA-binding protein